MTEKVENNGTVGVKEETEANNAIKGVGNKVVPITVFPLLSQGSINYAAMADKQIDVLAGISGNTDLMYQIGTSCMSPNPKFLNSSIFKKTSSLIDIELPCPEIMRNAFVVNLIAFSDKLASDDMKSRTVSGSLDATFKKLFDTAVSNLSVPVCPAFKETDAILLLIDVMVAVIELVVGAANKIVDYSDNPAEVYDSILQEVKDRLSMCDASCMDITIKESDELGVLDDNYSIPDDLRRELIIRALQLQDEGFESYVGVSESVYALAFSTLIWLMKSYVSENLDVAPSEILITGRGLAFGILGSDSIQEGLDQNDGFFTILMKTGLGITYNIGEQHG